MTHDLDDFVMHRVVYFGTPDYAVPALQALVSDGRFDVPFVVTQPDRPAGRERALRSPPVKLAAMELGIPVYQPASLRTDEARSPLAEADADVFVVAAYGLIFGRRLLDMPGAGCVNLHASLLPAYRGSSPVAAAILGGDVETGVTFMKMAPGIGTGDIIACHTVALDGAETTDLLTDRLGAVAGESLAEDLDRYLKGSLEPRPQDDSAASVTRKLVRDDGWIEWSWSADQAERHVRAMWSWPRAWTTCGGERLQVHEVTVIETETAKEPGYLSLSTGEALVHCETGVVRLDRVQPAGGRTISGIDWAHRFQGQEVVLGVDGKPDDSEPIVRPWNS